MLVAVATAVGVIVTVPVVEGEAVVCGDRVACGLRVPPGVPVACAAVADAPLVCVARGEACAEAVLAGVG